MGSSNSADQAWALASNWFWAWEVLDMGRAIIWRFRHRQPGCRNAKPAHFIDPPRVTGYSPGPRARGAGAPGSPAPPGADAGIRRLPYRRRAAGRGPGGAGRAPAPPRPPPGRTLVFHACHIGVVLRAVLFVELVIGVDAM